MRSFRPGWAPTLAMLGAVALLCALGTWQVRRLAWRQGVLAEWNARIDAPPLDLAQALAPGDHAYRRVEVRGRYDHARSVLVLNVSRDGRDGARVITPLLLDAPEGGAQALLVDRGWIPWIRIQDFPAGVPGDDAPVEVRGLLFDLELGGAAPGTLDEPRRRWMRFDPSRHAAQLQAQLPYRLAPLLIQREDEGSETLPLGGFERPRSPVDHRSYAITWYSMAVVAVGVWIGLGVQRGRQEREPRAGA